MKLKCMKKLIMGVLVASMVATIVPTYQIYADEEQTETTQNQVDENEDSEGVEALIDIPTDPDTDSRQTITQLTVKFVTEIGNIDNPTRTVTVGSRYGSNDNPLPSPYDGEYYCVGWYTAPDGGGTKITQDTVVDASLAADNVITLYSRMAKRVNKARILGTSLTLSGDIGLNFYLCFPEAMSLDDETKVVITNNTNGKINSYLMGDCYYDNEDGTDVFKVTYFMSAKNMADSLTLRVYNSSGVQQEIVNSYGAAIANNAFNYSVYKYIDAVQKASSNDRLKALANALKVYGDYARIYFGYNASGVSGNTEAIAPYSKDTEGISSKAKSESGSVSGITYVGSTLVLKHETAIRHYFTVNEGSNIGDYTFTVGDNPVPPDRIVHSENNLYYVWVASVPAQYGGYNYSLKVAKGSETQTITYNAISYVYTALCNSEDVQLQNVCKAFYGYYVAAVGYLGDPGPGATPPYHPESEDANNRFDETNLIITDGYGKVKTSWNNATVDGKTYRFYSDPATGKVVTGFNYIDGKMYYFGQSATDVGRMKTGFFNVASDTQRKYGASYYDTTPGASNRYYASTDKSTEGMLHGSSKRWEKITAAGAIAGDNAYQSQQVWSYYFCPNFPVSTGLANKADSYTNGVKSAASKVIVSALASELATGGVFIKPNGDVVTPEQLGASVNPDNLQVMKSNYSAAMASNGVTDSNYYRFNDVTGARARAVMFFYGNYYGWGSGSMWNSADSSLWSYFDKNQLNTIASEARWINSDTRYASISDDFITVNDKRNRVEFRDLGSFPMVSSSRIGDYNKDENTPARRYRFTNPTEYGERQDIAKGFEYRDGRYQFIRCTEADRDGHVDVYDTMCYSYDEYLKNVARYGSNNLVLMGASSGAGICVSLMMLANANNDPKPDKALLLCPWLDVSMTLGGPTVNGNSNTDLGTLRFWGMQYTRDGSYKLTGDDGYRYDYSTFAGPGMKYWMASPAFGFNNDNNRTNRTSYYDENVYGSFSGINNIYMYVGVDDPCKASCISFYNSVKATNSSANIVNNIYSGNNGYGHGFMFSSTVYTTTVLRDAAAKIMIQ